MQTFLPYPDFDQSAQVLDWRRLGKQRVEAKQIATAIQTPDYGWQNHPAVVQWRGHLWHLAAYGQAICRQWIERGFNDSLLDFFRALREGTREYDYPWWLGHEEYHASHRSNLLRKDPDHYGQFGWAEGPDLEYWWPSKQGA